MKKLFLIIFLCFGTMCIALGQTSTSDEYAIDYSSPEYKASLFTNNLIKELGLTGEQREKVYCARLSFLQKKGALMEVHKAKGGDSMGARMQLYEMRKTCDRTIREALTPTQIERYNAYLAAQEALYGH